MKHFFSALLGAFVASALIVASSYFGLLPTKDTSNPFLEYYTIENAVAVSPHDLRMEMDTGLRESIIVDLRSAPEYAKSHIRGAINIPGNAGDKNALEQKARIIREFSKLPKDKRIIVHCYTHYCMLAKHVGLMLAEEGIHVHELKIGWNEWRYEWDLWNGESTSKNIDITNYLEGTDIIKTSFGGAGVDLNPCTTDGLAGC